MNIATPELASQTIVSLTDMLDCREMRQARQRDWLARFHVSLISLTIVAPGEVKDSLLTRKVFNLAWQAIHEVLRHNHWLPVAEACYLLPTGPEALIAIDLPESTLKQAMIALEQTARAGRLWDIDVFDKNGNLLSRQMYQYSARPCLVCQDDARVCGRNRRHSQSELLTAMEKLIDTAQ